MHLAMAMMAPTTPPQAVPQPTHCIGHHPLMQLPLRLAVQGVTLVVTLAVTLLVSFEGMPPVYPHTVHLWTGRDCPLTAAVPSLAAPCATSSGSL